jgi:cytochrome P450
MTELTDLARDYDQLIQRPHDFYAALRGQPPLRFRFPGDDPVWLITGYDDVRKVLTDPRISRDLDGLTQLERRRAAAPGEAAEPDQGADDPYGGYGWIFRSVLYLDPPDHTRLRKLVTRAFTPRVIDHLRPRLEQVAGTLLDEIDGGQQEELDLLPAFAVPLPTTAISELLGVPAEDRPDFWAWSHVINGGSASADTFATLVQAADYLGALAERKRARPGEDLLSQLVLASQDGDRLSREELIAMALLMLLAGHDTTVNLIANGTLALLQAPDQLAALRAGPSLLPGAVEEVLRYDCPVHLSTQRYTLEPVELSDGTVIPAGEVLRPSILAANRDPAQFPDPDTFDISRGAQGHLGFGHGIHFCIGAMLARLEGQIALGRLFDRFPGLSLAASPAEISYRDSTLMHGPASLPVRLRPR